MIELAVQPTQSMAQAWQTPAWALLLVVVSPVVSGVVALVAFLIRRDTQRSDEIRASEHREVMTKIDGVSDSISEIEKEIKSLHEGRHELELAIERRIGPVEGKVDALMSARAVHGGDEVRGEAP